MAAAQNSHRLSCAFARMAQTGARISMKTASRPHSTALSRVQPLFTARPFGRHDSPAR